MPQGLSLSASLTAAFSVSIVSGSQRTFCPLPSLDRVLARLMSRGDELRQLAAQLSVLAALEDSIAVGLSRVLGPASPDRGAASPTSGSPLVPAAPAVPAVSAPAPSPSREGGGLSVALRVTQGLLSPDAHSLSLTCASAETRSTGATSQLQCCFWSAWLCCPRGVGTGHGLGHQELPTSPASPAASLTCRSCPPRCLDRVSAPRCRFWILRSHRSCPRGPSCHGAFVQLRRRMGRAP